MAFDETASLLLGELDQMSISANPLLADTNEMIGVRRSAASAHPAASRFALLRLAVNPMDQSVYGIEVGSSAPFPPTGQLVNMLRAVGHQQSCVWARQALAPITRWLLTDGRLFATRGDAASDQLVRLDPLSGTFFRTSVRLDSPMCSARVRSNGALFAALSRVRIPAARCRSIL